MLKTYIVSFLCLLYVIPGFSQEISLEDTVEVGHGVFSDFHYHGLKIRTSKDLRYVLQDIDDPEIHRLYKNGHRWNLLSCASGLTGGFLLGFPLSQYGQDTPVNHGMFYAGLGLSALSIILQIKANRSFMHAVSRYNYLLRKGMPEELSMAPTMIGPNPGLALNIRF